MSDVLRQRHGVSVMMLAPDGPPLANERAAVDLIGEFYGQDVDWLAIPVARLTPEFFRLRTRVAGEVVQKLQQYGLKLAVVGDISEYVEASTALRDFVYESNRGRQLWFVADEAALDAKLA